MSDSTDNARDAEIIAHDEFIHRALLRKRLINEDTDHVKPEAFLRRRDKDTGSLKEERLSVDRASLRSAQDFARSFNTCYGVVGLSAGGIREANLDVVPETTQQNDPSHAEITGWPDADDPDADAKEERLAGLLARKAQKVQIL